MSLNQLTIVVGILGAQIVNWLIAQPVPDGATDQIEMAQGELATAKTCIRLHGAVGDWKEPVEAAITILETLLDLTGGKETAGKDEE